MLDIAVTDDQVASTIESIKKAGRTGKIGDGKIFVLSIEAAYRIRTDEVAEAAI